MINFFSKNKIIFLSINLFLIILYIFPVSLMGCVFVGDCRIQPQITPNFIISSNHFYAFLIVSLIGFFTFKNSKKKIYIFIYLIALSIILEIFHLIIPGRSYQWSDLFGNFFGVIVVILINNFIHKYENFKK
tara:strand:+ start:398 stop:793 length:396 start_codon:yes stop_codon:yes gene_type:complete